MTLDEINRIFDGLLLLLVFVLVLRLYRSNRHMETIATATLRNVGQLNALREKSGQDVPPPPKPATVARTVPAFAKAFEEPAQEKPVEPPALSAFDATFTARVATLRNMIGSAMPPTRESALALTKLDETQFWMERAVANYHESQGKEAV